MSVRSDVPQPAPHTGKGNLPQREDALEGELLPPVGPDSEICQLLRCLPEKFIVDFANGIAVARDHLRVQRSRSGFFARCYDGFTGQGVRRQAEMNASLVDGIEASLKWIIDLSDSLARSNLAISRVNGRVSALTLDVAKVAG